MAHRNAMWSLVLHMGLPPDQAEDLLQDALAALWHSRSRLRAGPELRAYCLAAVRSRCLDRMRRHCHEVDWEEGFIPEFPAEDPLDIDNPREWIEEQIDHLPPAQQQVMRLSAWAELSNREIASLTGQSEANVRQLLSRARRKLKSLLGK